MGSADTFHMKLRAENCAIYSQCFRAVKTYCIEVFDVEYVCPVFLAMEVLHKTVNQVHTENLITISQRVLRKLSHLIIMRTSPTKN